MLSAGSPVAPTVIASIDRQVSAVYFFRTPRLKNPRELPGGRSRRMPRPAADPAGIGTAVRPTVVTAAARAATRVRRARMVPPSRTSGMGESLDAGHRDAHHDVALQGKEDHEDGDDHDRPGEQQAVLGGVLALAYSASATGSVNFSSEVATTRSGHRKLFHEVRKVSAERRHGGPAQRQE